MVDDEGYQPVDTRKPSRRPTLRRRLSSPLFWVAVALAFGLVLLITSLWDSRWALVAVVAAPFLTAAADWLILKQDDRR